MHNTKTLQIGEITLTHIQPLTPLMVRFACTVRIPNALTIATETDLALFQALFLSGTKTKSKADIETYLKRYGITLDVSAGRTSFTISGSVRKDNMKYAVALIQELLTFHTIPINEFKQKKSLALEHNREAHDDAKRIARIAFMNALYADEPRLCHETLKSEHARIIAAQASTLKRISTTLQYGTWYVSVVGDSETLHAIMPLVQLLNETASSVPREPIVTAPNRKSKSYATVPSKTNVEVLIGNTVALSNTDPAFTALSFGLDVLGKAGGFFGRLMSRVREKEGLTYGIYAGLHTHSKGDGGHFSIRTFFMAKDYEAGVAATLRELKLIVEKGITDTELRTFKEIHKNQHVLTLESNASRLALYHGLAVRSETEDDMQTELSRVAELTRKDVLHALRTHINLDTLVISAAGPITSKGKPIISRTL